MQEQLKCVRRVYVLFILYIHTHCLWGDPFLLFLVKFQPRVFLSISKRWVWHGVSSFPLARMYPFCSPVLPCRHLLSGLLMLMLAWINHSYLCLSSSLSLIYHTLNCRLFFWQTDSLFLVFICLGSKSLVMWHKENVFFMVYMVRNG